MSDTATVPLVLDRPESDPQREKMEAEIQRLRGIVRELSYVVHGLSHDLREPIRNITSFIEILQARTLADKDPNLKEYAYYISSAAQRMEVLVAGMLDYARVLGTEAEPSGLVDMNVVLQTALADLQMKIEETQATIVHDELPGVSGDFVQLTQLMQNLIGNAIKYRSTAPPQIFVKAEQADGYWQFSIQDNGIGIAPQYVQQLFIPFKRLHGQDVPGAGLGLAICRSIVERHGGSIWAESAPGKGTTFLFTLPLPRL